MRTLPASWSTERLSITDTVASELEALQQCYNASYDAEWVGSSKPDPEYLRKSFDCNIIPEEADASYFSLQTLRTQNRIVGFFHTLEAYPTNDIAFVGMVLFDQPYKGLGLGRELMEAIPPNLKQYKEIQLSVELRNWEGLRFWIAAGFDSIVKYSGDPSYSADNSARLVLSKSLT
jgi:ribosomal protein S18 acetylase RimI-like enzyme